MVCWLTCREGGGLAGRKKERGKVGGSGGSGRSGVWGFLRGWMVILYGRKAFYDGFDKGVRIEISSFSLLILRSTERLSR